MTTATKLSILSGLRALSKKPRAPKANIPYNRVEHLNIFVLDRIYRSLSKETTVIKHQ